MIKRSFRSFKMNKVFSSNLFLFLSVGGLVAMIDLGTTQLLLLYIKFSSILPVTIGFFAGLISSYILHAKISFSANLEPARQLPRFFLLVILNYFLTICIVIACINILNLSTIIGKVVSLPVVAINSYLISKYWIYRISDSAT